MNLPALIVIIDAKAVSLAGYTTDSYTVEVTSRGGELLRYSYRRELPQAEAEALAKQAIGRGYIDSRFWTDAL